MSLLKVQNLKPLSFIALASLSFAQGCKAQSAVTAPAAVSAAPTTTTPDTPTDPAAPVAPVTTAADVTTTTSEQTYDPNSVVRIATISKQNSVDHDQIIEVNAGETLWLTADLFHPSAAGNSFDSYNLDPSQFIWQVGDAQPCVVKNSCDPAQTQFTVLSGQPDTPNGTVAYTVPADMQGDIVITASTALGNFQADTITLRLANSDDGSGYQQPPADDSGYTPDPGYSDPTLVYTTPVPTPPVYVPVPVPTPIPMPMPGPRHFPNYGGGFGFGRDEHGRDNDHHGYEHEREHEHGRPAPVNVPTPHPAPASAPTPAPSYPPPASNPNPNPSHPGGFEHGGGGEHSGGDHGGGGRSGGDHGGGGGHGGGRH